MKKFTESIKTFDKQHLIDMVDELASDVSLEYKHNLVMQYDGQMIPIHEVEVDILDEKNPIYLAFEFSRNLDNFIDTDKEGHAKITDSIFNNFFELVNELKELFDRVRSFNTRYSIDIDTFDQKMVLLFERENNFEDYYEIMSEQILNYVIQTDRINKVESKLTEKGYVIEFDLTPEFKYFDKLSDKGIAGYFKPDEYNNSKAYDEYVDETGKFTNKAMNKEKWNKMTGTEKQRYWLKWFQDNIYDGLSYDDMITLNDTKFQLVKPIDQTLENYYPH